jgi:hypothetical protein
MSSQVIDTEQNLASQLIHSNVKVESIARRRHTRRVIPINGSRNDANGYSPGEEIEFNISSKDLLDCQTLAMCIEKGEATGAVGGFDGSIIAAFEDVEVYYGDKLIERISDVGVVYNAMTFGSCNDTYLTNEGTIAGFGASQDDATNVISIKGKAHKRRSGGFMCSLDFTGLAKIATFLPVYNHNLKIKIRLASNAVALDTDGNNSTYKLKGVSMLCDYVEVAPEYLRQLEATMMGSGLSIPIQTFQVYKRALQDAKTNTFDINVAYSEVDSIWLLAKNKTEATNKGDITNDLGISTLESMTMNLGGHYLTPTDGNKGHHENYVSMKKAFNELHNAQGSCVLNYSDYKDHMTLLGVNCESIMATHHTLGSGVNARELGYNLNVELKTTADFGNGKELICMVLHRKFINIFGGGVSVSE